MNDEAGEVTTLAALSAPKAVELDLEATASRLRRVLGVIEVEQQRRRSAESLVAQEIDKLRGMLTAAGPQPTPLAVRPPAEVASIEGPVGSQAPSTGPTSASKRKMRTQRRAVLRGERPALPAAIATVLGAGSLSLQEISDALHHHGWQPRAKDVNARLVSALCDTRYFKRLSRGVYKATAEGRARAVSTKGKSWRAQEAVLN